MAPGVVGMFVLTGLAACGSDTGSAPTDTGAVVSEPVASEPVVSEPDVSEPAATESEVSEPAATEPTAAEDTAPATDSDSTETTLVPVANADDSTGGESDTANASATSIELTPELEAFALENSELLSEWSAQLTTFGTEAVDNLGNVSAAPSAARLLELSDEVVAAIGAEATDPSLVTARDFASGVSTAINQSIDGDQEAALTTFFDLQAQAEALTETMDQFGS